MEFKDILSGYIKENLPLEDMLSVRGKVAIVTVGTSGLGFCVAQRLCQGGAKVVISSNSDQEAEIALSLLREQNYEVSFCNTDVRNEADVERLVAYTADLYGSVDILVTCAAIWGFAHIQDLPEKDFADTLDINLLGSYRCAKHVSRYMIEHHVKGKIIFVASAAAYVSASVFGGYAPYASSKGGVISLTQEVAKELNRYGILVNCVAPGGMATPGNLTGRNGPLPSIPEEKQKEIMEEFSATFTDIPLPSADSVAIVIYGLCTNMGNGLAGECVIADSGLTRNINPYQPALKRYPPVD